MRPISKHASLWFGAACIALLLLVAACAPLIAQHDASFVPQGDALRPPSRSHWFGTDQIGRDVFARVLYGARTSLMVGFASAAIAGLLGTTVGVLAGFKDGWVDAALMRVTDAILAFPAVVLAGALVLALGRGTITMVVVLGAVGAPVIARVVRVRTRQIVHEPWIEASRSIGCSSARVLLCHVVPHIAGAAVSLATLYVGTAILGEATLSFLAVGVSDDTASWGSMIAGGRGFIVASSHVVLFPVLALFVTISAVFALADGLRRSWDVSQ